jgi:hypothetical protein
MGFIIFLVVWIVGALLLSYLDARFYWGIFDEGFAWAWPLILCISPILLCIWASTKLEKLGQRHWLKAGKEKRHGPHT